MHLTRLKLRAAVLTRNCLPVESVQERRGRWENVSNNAKRYRPRHEAQQTSVFQRSRFAETLEPELRARVCEWRRHRYDGGHTYHSIHARRTIPVFRRKPSPASARPKSRNSVLGITERDVVAVRTTRVGRAATVPRRTRPAALLVHWSVFSRRSGRPRRGLGPKNSNATENAALGRPRAAPLPSGCPIAAVRG